MMGLKSNTSHDMKWNIIDDILTFLSVKARQYHTTEILSVCENL